MVVLSHLHNATKIYLLVAFSKGPIKTSVIEEIQLKLYIFVKKYD